MTFYEVTDTSVKMRDSLGHELEFHPIHVIEADDEDHARERLLERVKHDIDPDKVTVKEVA